MKTAPISGALSCGTRVLLGGVGTHIGELNMLKNGDITNAERQEFSSGQPSDSSAAQRVEFGLPLPEFVGDVALMCGVDVVVDRCGTWVLSPGVRVCWRDRIRIGAEPGWASVVLPGVDGKARVNDLRAPAVLVNEDRGLLIWRPQGDSRDQRRITLGELGDVLADMGEAQRAAGGGRRVA